MVIGAWGLSPALTMSCEPIYPHSDLRIYPLARISGRQDKTNCASPAHIPTPTRDGRNMNRVAR